MPAPPPLGSQDPSAGSLSIRRLFWGLGIVLGIVFLVTVLTVTLPPRLIDAQWQLLLASTLVNNASIVLLGVLLLRLAIVLAEQQDLSTQWRRRRSGLRRVCLLLIALFLLLVPVQIAAAWNTQRASLAVHEQQLIRSDQQLDSLREALISARSAVEMDGRLREFSRGAISLTATERRLPPVALRQDLLRRVDVIASGMRRQLQSQARDRQQSDLPVRESLRISLSALAYAYGFLLLGGWRLQRFRLR